MVNRKLLTSIFSIGLLVLFFFFLWSGLHSDPHRLEPKLLNKPIPTFQEQSLTDPSRKLTETIFKGRVSLLTVWASWCSTCVLEHPYIIDLARENSIRWYAIIYKDDRNKAIKLLNNLDNPYQDIINDPLGKISVDLGVYGTPVTFILDANGVIRYRHEGMIDNQVWRRTIFPTILKLEGKTV